MLDSRTETFLAVCREMNFTRAAEKLHITQPAVTQQIRFLEAHYGVKLFHFEGKKMFLTDAGKLLYRSFLAFYDNEVYLKEQLDFLGSKKRTLRFGATLTVGEFMVAEPLARFLRMHPRADIAVTVANTRELLQKLDTGEIDFALLEGDYPHGQYRHRTYRREPFIAVCSGTHVFPQTPHSLHDLKGECMIVRETGSGTRTIMEHILEESDVCLQDFANVVTVGNMSAIKDLVQADCGVTFLYAVAVKREIAEGTIRQIPLKIDPVQHEIAVVWKKENLFQEAFGELFEELFFESFPEAGQSTETVSF